MATWREREASKIDVEALWKEESEMSLQERRERYNCGDDFTTLSDVKPWTQYCVEDLSGYEGIHAKDAQEYIAAFNAKDDGDDTEETEDTDDIYQPDAEINRKVAHWRGNITAIEVGAIVNAANKGLLGGGGVDGAIHSAAGNMLYQECLPLGGADTGETKITRGYNLPAEYVLHTVGPIGENTEKLRSCYLTCLELVKKHNIRSVCFCGISTGIYSYPLYAASHVALKTIREWMEVPENRDAVDMVIVCTYLPKEKICYDKLFPTYFPPCPDPGFEDYWSAACKRFDAEDDEGTIEETADEEVEAEPPRPKGAKLVTLKIHYKTMVGWNIYAKGTFDGSNDWKKNQLKWEEGHYWTTKIMVPAQVQSIEYKYLIQNDENGEVYWEGCDNRKIKIENPDTYLLQHWGIN